MQLLWTHVRQKYPEQARDSPSGDSDDASDDSPERPANEANTVKVMSGIPARECTSDEQVSMYVPWDIR